MKKAVRGFAWRTTLVLAIALALTIAIVLSRTVAAGKVTATPPLQYPAPALDVSAAAIRLGTALRFETISYDDGANTEALEKFRAWLSEAYPRFHAITQRTLVGDGTLLFEWRGTDPSLRPIVLMAHQDVVPVPQPHRWRQPPFSGAIVNGEI